MGGVRNWAPRALHSAYTAWMSVTRMLRKLLTRSGSPGESDIGRHRAEDHRATEYLGVEAPGALDVLGDDEVGHEHSLCGLRGFGHCHLRWLGLMAPRGLRPSVNQARRRRTNDT